MFQFALLANERQVTCPTAAACWSMEDLDDGRIYVQASTASEATAAVGVYLRDYCNLTVGWPRGGGSFVQQPAQARAARIAVVDQRENHGNSNGNSKGS